MLSWRCLASTACGALDDRDGFSEANFLARVTAVLSVYARSRSTYIYNVPSICIDLTARAVDQHVFLSEHFTATERGEREKRFYGDGKGERRRTAF